MDGKVKSFRCNVREPLGMRRPYQYAEVTKDEAQRHRCTFYEAVNNDLHPFRLSDRKVNSQTHCPASHCDVY